MHGVTHAAAAAGEVVSEAHPAERQPNSDVHLRMFVGAGLVMAAYSAAGNRDRVTKFSPNSFRTPEFSFH